MYESNDYLDFPTIYREGMELVNSKEEFQVFQNIWLPATSSPFVVIDDSDYQPPRDPNLFPMQNYLSLSQFEIAKKDKMFDMTEHFRYVNSEDGKRRLINRINHGDFGKCPYCFTNLYPYGIRSKPLRYSYILKCPKCSYNTNGVADGFYFAGWIDESSKIFLSMLPSTPSNIFLTDEDSMNTFEKLKNIEEENDELDFKEKYEIHPKGTSLTNASKKELRKDICSFANNRGGYIFIGVREITKNKTKLIGILNHTLYIQELIDQIISSGDINPPIPNVKLHKIHYNKKWYIIIEINESNIGPHYLKGKIPFRFGKITIYFNGTKEWKKNKK